MSVVFTFTFAFAHLFRRRRDFSQLINIDTHDDDVDNGNDDNNGGVVDDGEDNHDDDHINVDCDGNHEKKLP